MTTTITTANHQVTRSTTNASSYTLGSYVVGSGSNRVLAVVVSLLRSNENGVKVTSVTFGGVGLTEGDHSGGISTSRSNYVGIWYLVNPSVSTANIVVTPDNAMVGCIISAVTLYGVHQTYAAGRSQRVKVAGNEFDIDVGLGATGGLCLMAASANANNNPSWTWTGSGELYDVNNGSSDSNEIAGSAVLRDSDVGGATCTCSISTAMMVGVGVEFLPVGLSIYQQTINVTAGSDDAIQNSGGTVSLNNTSANVDNTGNTYFAARFLGLNAPPSAYILSAYLRLSIASAIYATPFLNIQTEDNAEPATFAATNNNISSRSLSGDSVVWNEVNIGAGYQRSPNIFLPVQYVVGLGGWTAGDDIAVILTNAEAGSAFRFNTYDAGSEPPQLIVTWMVSGTTYTATPAGALTSGGAVAKAGRKPLAGRKPPAVPPPGGGNLKDLAGALSSAGSLGRSVGKPVGGQVSPVGGLARLISRALGGVLSFAGGLFKQAGRALGGVVSAGGDLSRRAGKTLGGAVASSGGLARRIGKALGGGLSPTGGVGSAFGKMLGGAVGLAGDVSRATGKTLAGALALVGELVIVSLPGGLVAGLVHLTAAARDFALTARERVFNLTVRNR